MRKQSIRKSNLPKVAQLIKGRPCIQTQESNPQPCALHIITLLVNVKTQRELFSETSRYEVHLYNTHPFYIRATLQSVISIQFYFYNVYYELLSFKAPMGMKARETKAQGRESWGAIESHTPIECGLRFSGETSDPRRPGVRPGQAGAAERPAAPDPRPHSHGQAGGDYPQERRKGATHLQASAPCKAQWVTDPGSVLPPSPGRRLPRPTVFRRIQEPGPGPGAACEFPSAAPTRSPVFTGSQPEHGRPQAHAPSLANQGPAQAT